MNWPPTLTDYAAIYAAILSTIVFFIQLRDRRPQIRAGIGMDMKDTSLVYFEDTVSTPRPMIVLSAINEGDRKVHLESHGFTLPNRHKRDWTHSYSGTSFPCELLPGKKLQNWVDPEELAKDLRSKGFTGKVKIAGYFCDETGRTYRSKRFKFDTSAWTK